MDTNVKKPNNLEQFELIVIMGLRESPKTPENLENMTFYKSLLAVNESEEKVQVYVNSKTQKGLNDFKRAYPNADIQQDATLKEPEKWTLLGFARYAGAEDETPLDIFYKAQHNEVETTMARDKVKEEGRKNK